LHVIGKNEIKVDTKMENMEIKIENYIRERT
jgi:hypothetical protein